MLFIISQPDELSRFRIDASIDDLLCVKSSDILQVCGLKDKFKRLHILDLFESVEPILDQHIVEQLHNTIFKLKPQRIVTYDLDASGLNKAVSYAVTMLVLNMRSINPTIDYIEASGSSVTYTKREIEHRLFSHYYGDTVPLIDTKYFNGV